MKRFFSLMLVVMLLVSAIPFQASAAGDVVYFCPNWPSGTPKIPVELDTNGMLTDAACTAAGVPALAAGDMWVTYDDGQAATFARTDYIAGDHIVPKSKNDAYKAEQDAAAAEAAKDQVVPVAVYVDGAISTNTTITLKKDQSVTLTEAYLKGLVNMTHRNFVSAVDVGGNNVVGGTLAHGADLKSGLANGYGIRINLQTAPYDKSIRYIVDGETHTIQNYYNGETINVPSAPTKLNYQFMGWYPAANGSGNPLVSGTVCAAGVAEEWIAWYIYNPSQDGMSTINVTARCYVDGLSNSYFDVPVLSQAVADTTNVFDWLTNHKNTTILDAVYAKVDTNKYEWKNRYFYNHNGTEVLTAQTTFADGSKSILIKLEEKDNTTRANVQLYLHSSSTSENPFRILDMNGYTSGMNVTREAAAKLVKEYYSYKNIGNLYTDADWNELMNGENNNGRTSVPITDNGTYKIHVVVTNASTKTNSNADTSNPKTGDYIMIAVGTMVLAAAAVITLAEMKKRKMI